MMNNNFPSIYEINTRVWLRGFDQEDHIATLADVPADYWDYLQERGISHVWLMGVWKTVDQEKVLPYALDTSLHEDYRAALPDWTEKDVIGSPYAIDRYDINPSIGTADDLAQLRSALHRRGMQLILDFVPNHFHAETSLLEEKPFLFIEGSQSHLEADPATFYRYNGRILAHGRDPYFPAWKDTVQVNYFDDRTREFMEQTLLSIAKVCDGLRCDMAMLVLNSVFESTWRYTPGFVDKTIEFWATTIAAVKEKYPDFKFIAEAYWDLEGQLQDLGFDYTYDKRLLDRLYEGNTEAIRQHLFAEPEFQARSVRFLENHDEDRILKRMDSRRAEAAAVITYTLPGMRFYHDGQWEGRRRRLPVQLGRDAVDRNCSCAQAPYLPDPDQAFVEAVCRCTYVFYQKLLEYLRKDIFLHGDWELIAVQSRSNKILGWRWRIQKEVIVVLVNYADHSTEGSLRLPLRMSKTTKVTEPWRRQEYEVKGDKTMSLTMYPYEYRFLEYRI